MALSVRARRAAVGLLLLATVAVTAPALAAPNKGYTVDIDNVAGPNASSVRGLTATFAVELNAPARQELGAARVTAPAGFKITDVLDAPPTTSFSGNVATINGLEIPSGGTRTVKITADVPCGGAESAWGVGAKQSNQYNGDPGNDLQLTEADSDRETALTGVCKPCPETGCREEGTTGNNKFAVRGEAGTTEDSLVLAFGTTLQIDCSSLGHQSVMSDTALFDIGDRTKTASLVVPRKAVPGGDVANLDLCFGSPDTFDGAQLTTQYDWDGDGVLDTVYVGLLPDCTSAEDTTCVFNRDRVARNDGIIEARLPAGDPGMRG